MTSMSERDHSQPVQLQIRCDRRSALMASLREQISPDDPQRQHTRSTRLTAPAHLHLVSFNARGMWHDTGLDLTATSSSSRPRCRATAANSNSLIHVH